MPSSIVSGPIIYAPVTPPVTRTANTTSLRSQVQQLGADVKAGNLTAAQQDYATLSQSGPLASKQSSNALVQDLQAVGKALQGGDIQGAQTAFSTFQTDALARAAQNASATPATHDSHHEGGHHHVAASNTTAQQSNPLAQAFTSLEQALQTNNLTGAQAAFATIQTALQQGGFNFGGASASGNGAATTTTPATTTRTPTGINVTA